MFLEINQNYCYPRFNDVLVLTYDMREVGPWVRIFQVPSTWQVSLHVYKNWVVSARKKRSFNFKTLNHLHLSLRLSGICHLKSVEEKMVYVFCFLFFCPLFFHISHVFFSHAHMFCFHFVFGQDTCNRRFSTARRNWCFFAFLSKLNAN